MLATDQSIARFLFIPLHDPVVKNENIKKMNI